MKSSSPLIARPALLLLAAWLLSLLPAAAASAQQEPNTASVLRGSSWNAFPVKPLRQTGPELEEGERSLFGGSLSMQREATGFFRVEKVDGAWWLIDPAGARFVSRGLNTVSPRDLQAWRAANGEEEPLDLPKWAEETHALMVGNGFNTLGAWSAVDPFFANGRPLPYTRVLHVASAFGTELGVAYARFGNTGFQEEALPVFHRDFPDFCERLIARETAQAREDPWLIGYFSDNELPFRKDNILKRFLALPESDDNHLEARRHLEEKYGRFDPNDITPQDDTDFCRHVIDTYFRVVSTALRRADPNHLFLGTRFHGMALQNPDLFKAAGKYVDVISVNYYHRWDPELERIAQWEAWSNRPLLVTEFYARRIPEARMDGPGAGYRVENERDRGLFYQNFVAGLLESPHCIGWHWHRFSDYANAAEGITQGIVTPAGQPHAEVLSLMQAANRVLPTAQSPTSR
jgi:hypothetical protein